MSQYIITDGSRFIYQNHAGQYVPISGEEMADKFTKKQAEGIYHNSLPKALRTVFRVEKYNKVTKNVKQVSKNDLSNNTEKVMFSDDVLVWLDKLNSLNGLVRDAQQRKIKLEKLLKEIEAEKIDIEHYIEFQTLNAAQGYKVCKEFKLCRIKRRRIKNELAVINIILKKDIKEEIVEEIKKLDQRTYHPKIRTDLFDL